MKKKVSLNLLYYLHVYFLNISEKEDEASSSAILDVKTLLNMS